MAAGADVAARPRILPRQSVLARDGAELCTDVYLPDTPEPRPTVVVRTPYGRNRPFLMLLASRLSSAGLCLVAQDCRGRYQSEGQFDLAAEEEDTRDTLEWLAAQEWSAERCALMGVSISSYPNFRAAARPVPDGVEIATVVSLMGVLDTHSLFYSGGALVLHWALPWITLMGPSHSGSSAWMNLPWEEILRRRPLARLAEDTGGHEELWRYVVEHPRTGEAWISAFDDLADLEMPALFVCGWHDFLLDHTLRGFAEATSGGGRVPHRLVLGDWNHQSLFYSFRAAEEGEAAHLDLMSLLWDWLAARLLPDGASSPAGEEAGHRPVLARILETDRWFTADSIPPAGASEVSWYLAEGDSGDRELDGGGALASDPPAGLGEDRFVYDPDDPVPTVGGAIWQFDPIGLAPGSKDQSAVEERDDVLIYTSGELDRDLYAIGPVAVDLWVTSSARDTDFTAKLVDVDAAGVPRIVRDGIQRARHRDPSGECWLPRQQPERLRVDLGSVAHRFAAGHRLRLEVSSSNFPKYDRHPNSVGDLATAMEGSPARQSVLHGPGLESRLVVTVVASSALSWAGPGTTG